MILSTRSSMALLMLAGCTFHDATPPANPASNTVPTGWPSNPGPKPVRKWNGIYQCMIDSMKAGQVTEAGLDNIRKWGWPKMESWEGYRYWTVEITFDNRTPFGMAQSRARAFIRDNRVHFWLYCGSDEVVP